MRAQSIVILVASVAAGFASLPVADDVAGYGWLAEAWMYSLAPVVLDWVPASQAWLAAGVVYSLQFGAMFSLVGSIERTSAAAS
jgi:hypothetical protein